MNMSEAKEYPIFLDLRGKNCLVVGGGRVAQRKVGALREAGANVTVVSPGLTDELEKSADSGRLHWKARGFVEKDLRDLTLVIAATDNKDINERVHAAARRAGVLANIVDQPQMCDFFVPAVLRRGRLIFAVSTGGASPAFAAHVRDGLGEEFGPEYGYYLELVGDFRRRVRERVAEPARRDQAYERLFASDVLERLRDGERIDVENLVAEYVL